MIVQDINDPHYGEIKCRRCGQYHKPKSSLLEEMLFCDSCRSAGPPTTPSFGVRVCDPEPG